VVKQRRQERKENSARIPSGVLVVGFVFIAALGYIAGTFHGQIIGAIAPALGFKTYAGTLDLSSLQATYQALKANYDGEIDDAALVEGANKGLVDAVGDEYTLYMNQTEAEEFDNDLTGNIGGGIGIELGMRNDKLTILRILKDNPAEKAGILVNDVVVSVNDESVEDLSVEAAVLKIRGDVGTTVKITVLRGSETKDFTITRAQVNNPSVYSSISGGVGIMTITRFDDETGSLARAAAQDFKNQGVTSVILDLRGNGGGYITAAQDVASLWLNDLVVVSERTNGKVVDELKSGRSPILEGIPTVVLVNASSASASEIVAGALQDHGVAKLVGVKTFGKGSVQKLIELPEGAELKVTVARWYTPKGANISQQGISPDKEADMTAEDISAGRDPQLDAAKSLLNE
jgi:carboxyl-terminal processing protease